MPNNLGFLLALLAFFLVILSGFCQNDLPLGVVLWRCVISLAIFTVFGRIMCNIGKDLFREAYDHMRRKRRNLGHQLDMSSGEELE